MNNLDINARLTFKELIKHGIENGANVVNEMPWSWKINGYSVTHENDGCYIIETIDGFKKFRDGDVLAVYKKGLHIFPYSVYDTHAPGSCPM